MEKISMPVETLRKLPSLYNKDEMNSNVETPIIIVNARNIPADISEGIFSIIIWPRRYSLLGAFRALVGTDSDGFYKWKSSPEEMWNKVGSTLVEDTIGRSRPFNNSSQSAGKDTGLWRPNYQAVLMQQLLDPIDS